MRYQQTLEIHQRLETVLRLIRTGSYSTPALAETIGVSIPTISRLVAALREQGHDIRAERVTGGWRYMIPDEIPMPGKRDVITKQNRTVHRHGHN
jgi:biotin operon repressor